MSQQTPTPQPSPAPQGVAGPEALDKAIQTTSPRAWWALVAIGAALVLVTVWAFVATVPRQTTAPAVISAFQYSYDISSPATGVVTFDARQSGQLTAGEQVGKVTPFDGGAPVPVIAPSAGAVKAIFVSVGAGVTEGELLASIETPPNPLDGIDLFAYLPQAEAATFSEGQEVAVFAEDLASKVTTSTAARVVDVAEGPSTVAGITTETGSAAIAEDWSDQAGDFPFRIILTMDSWPAGTSPPRPGQIVTVVNTYANIHPIQMLFSGGGG